MPYVNCACCGLVNFTVAYWASLDRCTGCGEPLPRPDSRSPSPEPRRLKDKPGGLRVS
ncbi:MAG: hypothetical protein JW895_06585 [Thermoleophilaceae bacterium]|nr:hypothetical protein [Thermoleophilaceae bacterium]